MAITHVKCNVEDHRLIDNGLVIEDITKVTLPTIEHPTTEVKASGMIMDVDMPNVQHYNAMEFTVAHNNGVNGSHLCDPTIHKMEFRAVRQVYNVALAEITYESFKARVTCVYKSTDKGDIETDNPYGSTEKYSVLRYEEEINGEVVLLIDSMAGRHRVNGVDYGDDISSMLD